MILMKKKKMKVRQDLSTAQRASGMKWFPICGADVNWYMKIAIAYLKEKNYVHCDSIIIYFILHTLAWARFLSNSGFWGKSYICLIMLVGSTFTCCGSQIFV